MAKDFNGDGRLDLATASGDLLLGNGDGTFQSPISTNAGGASVAVGDFNSDGRPELAAPDGDRAIGIFLNGTGTKIRATSHPNPSTLGEKVIVLVSVAGSLRNLPTPSGSVILKEGARTIGIAQLRKGRLSFATSKLTTGTHLITITYSGDDNYASSTAASITQIVK